VFLIDQAASGQAVAAGADQPADMRRYKLEITIVNGVVIGVITPVGRFFMS
jgi:hypothetical protein